MSSNAGGASAFIDRSAGTVMCLVLALVTLGCTITDRQRLALDAMLSGLPARAHVYDAPPALSSGLPELSDNSTLSDYLAFAALNNPGLQAAFERWKAALERIPQVTSLPDPRFTYANFIREVETRVGPQEQKIGIGQMFPWFGKLRLRGDSAAQAADAERQRYEDAKLKLFYDVQDAYYEYAYLARAIAITKENLDLLVYFEQVARTRWKADAATGHPDVIKAQVELGKLEDRLKTLQDVRRPIVARLNAALNRPMKAPLPWPGGIAKPAPLAEEHLLIWLADSNPQLRALAYEVERQKTNIDLARKDYFPDLTLGLDYIDTGGALMPGTRDDSKDPVIAMLSINVPIWRQRYRAGVLEAEARHRAARQTLADQTNRLQLALEMALYKFRDAERKIDLFRDTLIPKGQQSLRATEAAFRAGSVDFLDVLDAQRLLLEFELEYERARANQAQRLAEIEKLVGRGVTGAGTGETQPKPTDSPGAVGAPGKERKEGSNHG